MIVWKEPGSAPLGRHPRWRRHSREKALNPRALFADTQIQACIGGRPDHLASTGQAGYANSSVGTANLSLVSFTSTANSAVSVVNVLNSAGAAILQVTHDYHPLATTPYLYETVVKITNLTGADLAAGDLVYRRVMDWDIPSPGNESVSIQGVPALLGIANGSNVRKTDNNGFNSGNPFSFTSYGLTNTNYVNSRSGNLQGSASSDQGALFDFEFEALANGATRVFATYYGVAPNKATADAARSLVDGDASTVDIALYSYGSCASGLTGCDPIAGSPDTFIFGFGSSASGTGSWWLRSTPCSGRNTSAQRGEGVCPCAIARRSAR